MNIGILSQEKNNRYLITPDTAKVICSGGNNVYFTTELERPYKQEILRLRNYKFTYKELEETKKIFIYIKKQLTENEVFSIKDYHMIGKRIELRIKKMHKEGVFKNYRLIQSLYKPFYDLVSGYEFLNSGSLRLKNNFEIIKKCNILTSYKLSIEDLNHIKSNHTIISLSNIVKNKNKIEILSSKKATLIGIEYIEDKNGNRVINEIISKMAAKVGFNLITSILNRRGIILGNVPFNDKTKISILGYGNVGKEIADLFHKFDCDITIFEKDTSILGDNKHYSFFSINNEKKFNDMIDNSNIIISAIGNKYKPCPQIIKESHIKSINKEVLIFDFSINQGGAIEKVKETVHRDNISDLYQYHTLNKNVLYSGIGDILSYTSLSVSNYISNALVFYLIYILEDKLNYLDFFENAIIVDKGNINTRIEFIEENETIIPNIDDPFDLMGEDITQNMKNMDDVNELLEKNSNYGE